MIHARRYKGYHIVVRHYDGEDEGTYIVSDEYGRCVASGQSAWPLTEAIDLVKEIRNVETNEHGRYVSNHQNASANDSQRDVSHA